MRHTRWLILLGLGLVVPAAAQTDSTSVDSLLVPAKRFPLAGHVYVVDPGHGGQDKGTQRPWPDGQKKTFLYEKQFTLGLAIELTKQISDLGGTVVATVVFPDSLKYLPFGQNQIPATGAEYFNLTSRPVIEAKALGLSKRLQIGSLVLDRYPDKTVHWISIHFDHLGSAKSKAPVSGVRICYSSETAETTFVQVTKLKKTRPKVNGKRVTRWVRVTADSIVLIRPPSFAQALADAFDEADLLRDAKDQPIVSGSRGGFKRLFILSGKSDPNLVVIRQAKKRKTYNRVYNQILDPVLIEYAVLNNETDWQRLQQPEGSLKRLAEITAQGLVKHAQQEDGQRDP